MAFGRCVVLTTLVGLLLTLGAAAEAPLSLPGPFAPDSTLVGRWEGRLAIPGGASLRIVFHIAHAPDGGLSATMDSPDQGAVGIPVARTTFQEGRLLLDLTAIGAQFEGALNAEGKLAGVWRQGGGALPMELEGGEGPAGGRRPQEPAPPFPYRAEEVRYPNAGAGIHLAGTLTLPEGGGPFPTVVLISGSGPQDRDSEIFGHRPFLVLADYLTRRGIAVLRSDDRGVGASEGDFSRATSQDFADDAAAAVTYLRSRPEARGDAVGLIGMSEGGLVAPMLAAAGEPVAFLVLLAGPGVTGEEILYSQAALIARAMGAPEPQIEHNRTLQEQLFRAIKEEAEEDARRERMEAVLRAQFAEVTDEERRQRGLTREVEDEWIASQVSAMGGPWFRYFLLHDPRPVLRQVRVPVLALGGELDLQVPSRVNLPAIEAALREGGNPDVTVAVLPGLNHLFQPAVTGAPSEYATIAETMSPAAMERVASWVLERAGAPRP